MYVRYIIYYIDKYIYNNKYEYGEVRKFDGDKFRWYGRLLIRNNLISKRRYL